MASHSGARGPRLPVERAALWSGISPGPSRSGREKRGAAECEGLEMQGAVAEMRPRYTVHFLV
jgi:hypothetical protein